MKEQGFTLIELMIAVAIIGILVSVAASSYQGYIVRAQVFEAFSIVDSVKSPIVSFFSQNGICPENSASAVGDIAKADKYAGKYITQITISSSASSQECLVAIDFGAVGVSDSLKNKTIVLTMTGNNSALHCLFPNTTVDKAFLPKSCL